MQISITNEGEKSWRVVYDGRILEHLTWDEMLGSVAKLTLTGKQLYAGRTISEPDNFWDAPKGLLKP